MDDVGEGSGAQQPSSSRAPRQCMGMSPAMTAIMEAQVEELRKKLHKFKVCASNSSSLGMAPPGPSDAGDPNGSAPQAVVPPHADILVFGPSGSGKSSLIRTFYMALNKVREVPSDFAERIIVKDTAMNEGTLKYVSAVIKPPKFDIQGGTICSAILCHDTRGHIWMDEREHMQLAVILDGNVKDDSIVQQRNYRYARLLWEFWRRNSDLFPPEIMTRNGGLQTKPHAVLFVFDGSMDEIPDGREEIEFYRDIIRMAEEKGYLHPQVILTRIDRVEEELTKSSTGCEDPELRLREALDKKIEGVVANLGIPRTSVHFIENYHTGTSRTAEDRNVSVEFHALKLLDQCCSYADDFVSHNLQSTPKPGCAVQ